MYIQGGLRLLADGDGRLSSDIPKRYTGARDTTFARSARNNWIPKRDGYIHTCKHIYIQTISEMRRRISCLALRRSAINVRNMRVWRSEEEATTARRGAWVFALPVFDELEPCSALNGYRTGDCFPLLLPVSEVARY